MTLAPHILQSAFVQTVAEMYAAIAASPYRNRKTAALYIGSSPSTIDRLRMEGRLTPKYLGSTPLYLVKDLDRIVEEDSPKKGRK